MTDIQLAAHFFFQLSVILIACRAVGWLGRRMGQSQVVSEMIAGVLLGPSLLGLLAPSFHAWLFPMWAHVGPNADVAIRHPSMSALYVTSQLGLVIYMFLVGLELDLGLLKSRRRGAVAVSLAGLFGPLLLGGALGFALHSRGGLFSPQVTPVVAGLFLGAAMAITAFPMLARIIEEYGIAKTSLGILTLGAAASNDAVAWCLLAIVISMLNGSPQAAFVAIGGGAAFVALLLTLGRRAFRAFGHWTDREGGVTATILVSAMIILLLGGWLTDSLGIHSIFGSFMIGVAMPRGEFAKQVRRKVGPLVVGVLLPVYFVYSGLNTRIGLLDSTQLWAIAAVIILVAAVSKGGACALAARVSGEPWRDSLMVGVLMNTRGLVELILLNIGLQSGIITPTLFTMMVLMTVVTIVMVAPIFNRLHDKNGFGLATTPT